MSVKIQAHFVFEKTKKEYHYIKLPTSRMEGATFACIKFDVFCLAQQILFYSNFLQMTSTAL